LTFEETEKRRADLLRGPDDSKGVGRGLLALFVILTLALIYLIAAPYTGQLGNDYAATAGVGALGAIVLLGARFMTYRKAHAGRASLSLAVLDVLAWLGVVGVLVWSFVFPALHAFPASTILYLFYLPQFPIGVYSLTFIWAMLIVLRVVLQPFTKPPSEKVYADIESSLRRLTDTVDQVGQKMRGTDQKVDPALVEKVSSIMSEISAVRKELTTIKTTGSPVYAAPPAPSAVRVVVPQARQAAPPRVQATVASAPRTGTAPAPSAAPGDAPPDSTVDNPWLDVLAKRKAKNAKQG
jgi:hypothetical protein